MTMARRLRQRLEKVHEGQFEFFRWTKNILPEVNKIVDELRSSLAVKDVSIPAARKSLDVLRDHIRAIEEAAELDRLAVAKLAAVLGQFMEEKEAQQGRMNETARLAMLYQYFEIAARGDTAFWIELFSMVDAPVYQAAREKYIKSNPERAAQIFGSDEAAGT